MLYVTPANAVVVQTGEVLRGERGTSEVHRFTSAAGWARRPSLSQSKGSEAAVQSSAGARHTCWSVDVDSIHAAAPPGGQKTGQRVEPRSGVGLGFG